MKFKKKEMITREVETVEKVVCDLCKQEFKERDRFKVDEVTIEYNDGVSYPGDCSGTVYTVDMCSECFRDKFLPWLSTFGATPSEVEY